MRAVIYDHEAYEPLTVIEIPQQFVREIEANTRPPVIVFPVIEPFRSRACPEPPEAMHAFRTVRVRFEPIHRGRGERFMWLCTTADHESALLLRSVFLPGQRGEVNRQLEAAFLKGLLAAMSP